MVDCVTQPDSAIVVGLNACQGELERLTFQRQAVEGCRHAAAPINARCEQNTHLIKQASIEETGVDGSATDNRHTLHTKVFSEKFCARTRSMRSLPQTIQEIF